MALPSNADIDAAVPADGIPTRSLTNTVLKNIRAEVALNTTAASDALAAANSASNTSVKLTGAQTVAGVKTFSSIPLGPASNPTTDNQLTRKAFVDSSISSAIGTAVLLTGNQTVAGTKTFSTIPVAPAADPTTANQLTRKGYVDSSISTAIGTAVLVTGNQTVAGIKTFSAIPVAPSADPTTANQLTRKGYVDTLGVASATPPLVRTAGVLSVTPGAAVDDAVDENDVVVQFNALLASLRAGGFIAI